MKSVAMALGAACCALALACPVVAQKAPHQKPQLSSSLDPGGGVSTDGNLDLEWLVDDATAAAARAGHIRFEVEESSEHGLIHFDAGPYLSAALSGRDDGVFRYRVRAVRSEAEPGPWSDPLEVRVAHHPLWLAGLIFCIGAVVFLATTTFIVVSHRRVRATG